jgi:hypothetical protein
VARVDGRVETGRVIRHASTIERSRGGKNRRWAQNAFALGTTLWRLFTASAGSILRAEPTGDGSQLRHDDAQFQVGKPDSLTQG